MFRSALRYLKFKPADGLRVVARGQLSVYEPKGEYQLVCEHLEPHGLGALQLAFDQLKKRLQDEGLFDAARKRPAARAAAKDRHRHVARRRGDPRHPQRAAAPLRERPRRHPAGARAGRRRGAARSPARCAPSDACRAWTSLIVGRGGGSIEDLWAFNEEVVARAIAAAPVPVISAVGHETDVTIADFVADVRAPTPSAAAELVVARERTNSRAGIDRLHERLVRRGARARAASQPPGARRRQPAGDGGIRRAPGDEEAPRRRARSRALARCDAAGHRRARPAAPDRPAAARTCSNLARQLGTIRTRLVVGRRPSRGRRRAAASSVRTRRCASCASRLDTLSPLAVLGRGLRGLLERRPDAGACATPARSRPATRSA